MKRLTIKKANEAFKEHLVESGYAKGSIKTKLSYLKYFFKDIPPKKDIRDMSHKQMIKWLKDFDEKGLKNSTKQAVICTVRVFFKALNQKGLILVNPSSGLKIKREEIDKHKLYLTQENMQRFLNNIDTSKRLNLRDKALFELIYSSGLRASEASEALIEDLNVRNRTLQVRFNKNKKDRIVPITMVALEILKGYLGSRRRGPIFLNRNGKRIGPQAMNVRFKEHLKDAGLYREGLSIHSIRHSTAVHLLKNGADLRNLQVFLGHSSMESTVIYTKLADNSLMDIYRLYHPRENELYTEVDDAYLNWVESIKIK